ncbi:MAG: hypothetical protein KKF50_02890 [Nanoarchaeota archaeon]|nr:hypothetical protein [Nanoarchaeota archaeon]
MKFRRGEEVDYRYYMVGSFEGESVMVAYENEIVIPKDFDTYEKKLWELINYVDKVGENPLGADPSAGLWEIAGLKDDIFSAIEGIDFYFSEDGKFHKKELKNIRDHLEGRLEMLVGPISKLGNLLKKVNPLK